MRLKKCDRNTPILFLSGDEDLLTKRGKTTNVLANIYKRRKFNNVSYLSVAGRHEILFEKNRFENMDIILEWLNDGEKQEDISIRVNSTYTDIVEEPVKAEKADTYVENVKVVDVEIKKTPNTLYELQEADDELLINTNKESE